MGNNMNLGNYHQCLAINKELENIHVQGKYCTISLRLPNTTATLSEVPNWAEFDPTTFNLINYEALATSVRVLDSVPDNALNIDIGAIIAMRSYTLAVCIPKPCTTDEGISGLLFNLTELGFEYEDRSCRFRDDKPWVPADYVAITIFSIIGFFTLVSTSYDVWYTFVLKKDSKEASKAYKSFSVYTNARRLTTFTSQPGALECVDGIRALAITWVIVAHTFSTLPFPMNLLDTVEWIMSIRSLWIRAAPINVDTFFMLSGLLIVYTTAGKLTNRKLLRNLHLFYLHRILRMFPLLATAILLQASILHRIADGPQWGGVASETNNCRTYWWSTLLYVQNFVNPQNSCVSHTWYLAIDMQLHILAPIILFWVLGRRRKHAWWALTLGLLITLTAASIYIIIMEFPGSVLVPSRLLGDPDYYINYFYVNTLTRSTPFLVGMVIGYLLHLWRGKTVGIPKILVIMLWAATLVILAGAMYIIHPMMDLEYDNQILDSFVNIVQRPAWAMSIGWIIFACVHGYGDLPIPGTIRDKFHSCICFNIGY